MTSEQFNSKMSNQFIVNAEENVLSNVEMLPLSSDNLRETARDKTTPSFAMLFLAQNRSVPATIVTPPQPAMLFSADHSNTPWVPSVLHVAIPHPVPRVC